MFYLSFISHVRDAKRMCFCCSISSQYAQLVKFIMKFHTSISFPDVRFHLLLIGAKLYYILPLL